MPWQPGAGFDKYAGPACLYELHPYTNVPYHQNGRVTTVWNSPYPHYAVLRCLDLVHVHGVLVLLLKEAPGE